MVRVNKMHQHGITREYLIPSYTQTLLVFSNQEEMFHLSHLSFISLTRPSSFLPNPLRLNPIKTEFKHSPKPRRKADINIHTCNHRYSQDSINYKFSQTIFILKHLACIYIFQENPLFIIMHTFASIVLLAKFLIAQKLGIHALLAHITSLFTLLNAVGMSLVCAVMGAGVLLLCFNVTIN